jgi:hypothetical protein
LSKKRKQSHFQPWPSLGHRQKANYHIARRPEFISVYEILLANYAAIGLRASKANIFVLAKGTSETQLLNLTMSQNIDILQNIIRKVNKKSLS